MKVKEAVGNEYWNWKEGQIIVINAPTGSGKSTFIETEFKNFALQSGKRILYCTNRVMLKNQMLERQNARILEEEMRPKPFWQTFWKMEYGNFQIITYQQIEAAVLHNNSQAIDFFRSFDIVIADECHYFLADSNFNPNTIVSFEFILTNFKNRQIIFMSATMRNFYGLLLNYLSHRNSQNDLYVRNMFQEFKYYEIEPDYTGIDFGWVIKNEEIEEKIAAIPSDKKIIIFVSSIREGKEIEKIVKKAVQSDEVFLFTSNSVKTEKGEKVRDELVKNQKFSQRVLIATALLDTGVNIIDADVQYIFLLQNNEEEAIQMLGRRRRNPGELLYVFLHARSQVYFKKLYQQLKNEMEYIRYICNFERANREYFDVQIAKEFYVTEKAEILKKFIGMNAYSYAPWRYFVNELSVQRICQQMEEFATIIAEFDEKEAAAYLHYQGRWFGYGEDALKFQVPHTYLEQIAEFMSVKADYSMGIDEFNLFRSSLMPLLHQADGKMFPKMTENAKWQKLNDFFAKNNLPFTIQMVPKNKDKERSYIVRNMYGGLIHA